MANVLVVIAGLVPVLAWRLTLETFAQPRMVALAVGALLVVGLSWARLGRVRQLTIAVTGLGLLVWQFAASSHPMVSITGSVNIRVGLVTVWSLITVATVLSAQTDRAVRRVLDALVFGSAISSAYALVQWWDLDPIDWFSEKDWVASTFGNPNIGSAVYAIGAVLALGLSRGETRRGRRAVASIAVALLFGGLHATESFQGVVALIAVAPVIALWCRPALSRLATAVLSLVVSGGLIVWMSRFTTSPAVVVSMAAGASLVLLVSRPLAPVTRRRAWIDGVAALVLVAGGALAVVAFDGLRRQVEQGHFERRFFWTAALDMFGDAPIFGRGFDQYAVNYTRYRPAEHARILENVVASSPHSMYLSLLVSTGIVGCAIVVAGLVVMSRRLIAERSSIAADPTRFAVVAAALAVVPIAAVSIDNVAILTSVTVVIGALVAGTTRGAPTPTMNDARERLQSRVALSVSGVLGFTAIVVAFMVFIGGVMARRSEDGRRRSDGPATLDAIEAAHRFEPWNATYTIDYGRTLFALGREDEAVRELERGVRQIDYRAPLATQTARLLAKLGDYTESIRFLDEAIDNDPYARKSLRAIRDAVDEIIANRGSEIDAEVRAGLDAVRADVQTRLDALRSDSAE